MAPRLDNHPPTAVDDYYTVHGSLYVPGPGIIGNDTDPDGDSLSFEWTLNGTLLGTNALLTTTFPQGTNVVTLKVSDPCDLSSETNVTVVVVGQSSHELAVTPSVLWPPNHKAVAVKLTMSSNACGTEPVDSKIVSITCNEPTGPGDIRIAGDLTAKLAAWRDPHGNGRTYTITVRCSGADGQSSTSTVTVKVPRSIGRQ